MALRWWLHELPAGSAACCLRDETLPQRRARLVALDVIVADVLEALAADLGQFQLAGATAALLHDDVTRMFRLLVERDILQLIEYEAVRREAFVLASYFAVPLLDAAHVVLTEALVERQPTLIVADRPAYERLRRLREDRPVWRLAWLPDLLGPSAP